MPELFSDSFNSLSLRDAKYLKKRSIIASDREEAIDEGRVKKEWFTLLSKEILILIICYSSY